MVTTFHHTPVNAILFFDQFDGLSFDGLAGKCQNIKIPPPHQNFAPYGTTVILQVMNIIPSLYGTSINSLHNELPVLYGAVMNYSRNSSLNEPLVRSIQYIKRQCPWHNTCGCTQHIIMK